jgi:hypothetical protein
MLNIEHRQMTAYLPKSNGAVERLYCHLKDPLRTRATAATWADELPFVLLGLRGKTQVFPRLKLFLEPQLFCQMSFCSLMSLLLILLLKIFKKH